MKGRNAANMYPPDVQAEVAAACRENREIALSKASLEKLGHRRRPLLRVVREMCIDCQGGSRSGVRRCTSVGCSLWPFRLGDNPFHKRRKAGA